MIQVIYIFSLISSPVVATMRMLFPSFTLLNFINTDKKTSHCNLQSNTYHWLQYTWGHFSHSLTHTDSWNYHSYWYIFDHMIHQGGIHQNLKETVRTIQNLTFYDSHSECHFDYSYSVWTDKSLKIWYSWYSWDAINQWINCNLSTIFMLLLTY